MRSLVGFFFAVTCTPLELLTNGARAPSSYVHGLVFNLESAVESDYTFLHIELISEAKG